MRRWIEAPFAPGHTSIKGGLFGLFVAPTAAFILVPLPLSFLVLGGDWGGERSNTDITPMLQLIGFAFLVELAATLVIGGATWIVLRMAKRESGAAYTLAGAVEGLLWMAYYGHIGLRPLQLDRLLALGFCAVAGGLVALAFWLIARERTPAHAPAAA